MSLEIESKDVVVTEFPICAVEYDQKNKFIYSGAYELLDGETSERKGKLTKWRLTEDNKLEKVLDKDTGAILDMKFDEEFKYLYFVDDRGQLTQVTEDEICGTFSISSGLLMSVSVLGKCVATSSSVGSVSIYDTETMKETDWLPCHDDAECWIVTLGQNKQMFTGGDDSYFRLWDLRSHESIIEKRMSAGQTSCEFHPHDENILAQGGYDDLIRLWDKRNWKKPLSEIHLRGGVWRTRFNQAGDKILVPCMYENATIISVKENELKEEWRSKVHESITYGGCWLEDRKCFVTSSFYDKRLASWSY